MLLDDIKPTLAAVLQWRDALQSDWTAKVGGNEDAGIPATSLYADIALEESIYFQRFAVQTVDGRYGVKTGSAPSDADAAIDSLTPEDMIVTCKPLRSRKKYADQAEKMQKFGSSLLDAWRKRKDILRLLASDQVIRRFAVSRVMYDDRLWPPPPEGLEPDDTDDWLFINRRKCPIVLQRRDPRYVRWRETDDGDLLVVCEDYYASALDVRADFGQYPAALDLAETKDPDELVRVSDLWIGKYRCILLDDRPVFPIGEGDSLGVAPHGYPDIPYCIAPFRELPFNTPSERFRGMLTNSTALYTIESQVLTMNMTMLAWNAWRTWIGKTVDGRPMRVIPGEYIQIDQTRGEYLQMLTGDPVPPELLQMADVVDHYIQRNGVAQGPRTSEGTRSAAQLWAIQAMRQAKIDSAKDALQRMCTRAVELGFGIIEQMIGEAVTLPCPGKDREGKDLGEVTLGPSDIRGYRDGCRVFFTRRIDPALLEQAKTLMTFATNNWMPMEVSWKLSGLTDSPEEWRDLLITQSTERLPFILELVALERAKSWYGEDDPLYQKLLEKIMASQQPSSSPGGSTGGPGGAQQPGGAPPGAPGMPSGGAITPPSAQGSPDGGVGGAIGGSMRPGRSGGPRGSQRRSSAPPPAGGPGPV